MDIEISTIALLKISAAVLGTYFVLPVVLVGRDFILWALIDKFVLTDELRHKVQMYAVFTEQWNAQYVKTTTVNSNKASTQYLLDGEEITKDEYDHFTNERNNLGKVLEEYSWYIKKRSNLVSWLLKHYKQDSNNPIPEWLSKSREIEKLKHGK